MTLYFRYKHNKCTVLLHVYINIHVISYSESKARKYELLHEWIGISIPSLVPLDVEQSFEEVQAIRQLPYD